MDTYLPSSFIYIILRYVIGLRWICMHLWMNLIKRTINIQERKKEENLYVQSQWRVVLLWYHIFWQSSIQRGRHIQLCIITFLKMDYPTLLKLLLLHGFVKLLSTHPIHIVVWGNFPFNTNTISYFSEDTNQYVEKCVQNKTRTVTWGRQDGDY